MCIFTASIDRVSGTNVFARVDAQGRQYLAYEMKLAAAGRLAMVLPIPVVPGSGDDAVTWIDLQGYPNLFTDLNRCFESLAVSGGIQPQSRSFGTLAVVQVGDFDASYVPSPEDFSRLDPRFRLPSELFTTVPDYADWGFAVFKLRHPEPSWWQRLRGKVPYEERSYHPMALSFPTRAAERVFFPTVHIHDGQLHEHAHFDHSLYVQGYRNPTEAGARWFETTRPVATVVDLSRAQGVVEDAPCYRLQIRGMHRNHDIWAELGTSTDGGE